MTFLVAAYSLVWIGLLAYCMHLGSKQNQINREIEALTATLAARGK